MSHFIKLMLSSINGFVTPKSDGIVKVGTDENTESQWKVLQLPGKVGNSIICPLPLNIGPGLRAWIVMLGYIYVKS